MAQQTYSLASSLVYLTSHTSILHTSMNLWNPTLVALSRVKKKVFLSRNKRNLLIVVSEIVIELLDTRLI